MEYKKLTINILDAKDRREIFERSCELLSLDAKKEAKKIGSEIGREGFILSTEKLLIFSAIHNLHGQFDFRTEEKLFLMFVPELPATGKIAIDSPQTINTTTVDTIEPEDEPVVIAPAIVEEPISKSDEALALADSFKSVSEAPFEEPEDKIDSSPAAILDEDEDDEDPF